MKKRIHGFTLIELIFVVVIIGILAAVAVPNFLGAQDKAKNSAVQANLHNLQIALEAYGADNHHRFPTGLNGTVLTATADYLPGNRYPTTPWGFQQASSSDIPWVDRQVNNTFAQGRLIAPSTETHFGAVLYTRSGSANERYDIGGTGKKGNFALRIINLKNY